MAIWLACWRLPWPSDKSFGRDISDAHYKACLYAGINTSGTNGEVMPGQWEFQVGPSVGIEVGDHIWCARYLLERITEQAGVVLPLDPKPIEVTGMVQDATPITGILRANIGFRCGGAAARVSGPHWIRSNRWDLHLLRADDKISLLNRTVYWILQITNDDGDGDGDEQGTRKRPELHFSGLKLCLPTYSQTRYDEAAPEYKPYRQKDGALLAIGALCDKLKQIEPYKSELEPMLVRHVFPEFSSPVGQLRAKAAWVAGQYAHVNFSDPNNFRRALHSIVTGMRDPELPVRVDSVFALRSFVEACNDLGEIRPILPQLLDDFFKLMDEVENKDLVFTLETIVDKFGEEMDPLWLSLLTHQFGRENFISTYLCMTRTK